MDPLEFIYYLGYSFNKSRSLKNRKRLPAKVISVGNITVGGTGKTPAVIAIAEKAKEYGYRPCILTRGYKGKAKGPCFVSKGEGPLLDIYEAGDEPFLMAERLKGVPVVKGADRYEAGMFAMDFLKSQIPDTHSNILFILDDGFQHRKLDRDVDILLIDGLDPFGNRKLLPTGRLREPLREIWRAGVIVITRMSGRNIENRESGILMDEIRKYNPSAPVFLAGHLPSALITSSGKALPVDSLRGEKVFAFCGIGNPDSFRETLKSLDTDIRGFRPFRDHASYRREDLSGILGESKRCNAGWIVTTEKDIMKIRELGAPENLVALRIAFAVEESFYERILGGSEWSDI